MFDQSLKLSDFKNICRICMKLLTLSNAVPINKTLNMIKECSSVQIFKDDKLPQQVCEYCFQQLENAYALKQLCEKSDQILRTIIEQHISEPKTDNNTDIKDEIKEEEEEPFRDTYSPVAQIDIKNEFCDTTASDIDISDTNANETKIVTKKRSRLKIKIECNVCKEIFFSERSLRAHKRTHLSESLDHSNDGEICNKKQDLQTKIVRSKMLYNNKIMICEICGKSLQQRHLKKHVSTVHENVRYPCKMCSKIYHHKYSLKHHINRVHKKLPLKYGVLCNICGKGIKSQCKLEIHLRTHTGDKPFACEMCDKKYRVKDQLKTHVERVHLDIRTHVCSICSRAFFDKRILKSHMTIHTGEKPHQCKVCQQRFGQQAALWTHMKKHSENANS